jgi:hypothetical protein
MTNNRRVNLSDPVRAGVSYRAVRIDYVLGNSVAMAWMPVRNQEEG